MALFEIEDQYLDRIPNLGVPVADRTQDFRRARDHELFIQQVAKSPKSRDKILEIVAESGEYVPELERMKQARSEFASLLDERMKPLDNFLEEQKKQAEERQHYSNQKLVNDGRGYLREQGWDDKGIEEVETFMRDNSVGSYRVASEHLQRQKPDPTPLPSTSWNGSDLGNSWFTPPEDDTDHKLLLQNPQAFAQRETAKFVREMREGRMRR